MTTLNPTAVKIFNAEGLNANYHVRKFLAEQAMEAEPLLMAFADFFGESAVMVDMSGWRRDVPTGLPRRYPSGGNLISTECGQSMLRCIAREIRAHGFEFARLYVRGYLAVDARFLALQVQPEGQWVTNGAELLCGLLTAMEQIVATYGDDTLDSVLARWGITIVGTVAGWMMDDPSVVKGRLRPRFEF